MQAPWRYSALRQFHGTNRDSDNLAAWLSDSVQIWTASATELQLQRLSAPRFAHCPGGKGAQEVKNDPETISFLRQQSSSAQIVSVCTGALILAEAGILAGHKATTHHSLIESLQRISKHPGLARSEIHTGGTGEYVGRNQCGHRLGSRNCA